MMRVKLTFLALFLGLICIKAQVGTRFSVFVNPTVNWFQSDVKTVKSGSAILGYDIGLTIDKYFADNYAFTTGVSIGSLGGNIKYVDGTTLESTGNKENKIAPGTTVEYNLQYITIPTGFKFKTREMGYFTYFANLGLTTNLNIKARATSKDAQSTLDEDNIRAEINFFNMGYHIGAGVQYSLGGNTALVAGITFTNGFMDVTENDKDNISTSSLALRLGILF